MTPSVHRILIVGLGSIGRRHARVAKEIFPDAQIFALRRKADGDPEPGIDGCVTDVASAINLRPHAAVVANPSTMHLSVAVPLAKAGIHLLVEKPLAERADGVAELIALCGSSGTVLMTGYNLRFLPSLRELKSLVHANGIGRVLSVRAEVGQYLPSWRNDADYRVGVSANAALGGGVLLELSHDIDYLRWIFGEIDWVSAITATCGDLEIDVEDTAHLRLGFGGPRPLIATLDMDFLRRDSTRGCTVIGERGTLRWNGIAGTVEHFTPDDSDWTTLFSDRPERDFTYRAEWQQFASSITRSAAADPSGEDGLAVLRVIEAARRSATDGAMVRVAR